MKIDTAIVYRIKLILSDIASVLVKVKETNYTNLMQGSLGRALFLGYYDKLNGGSRATKYALDLLEKSIDLSSSSNMPSSLGVGFTGICWVVKEFYNLRLLDESALEFLEQANDLVEKSFAYDIYTSNYDLLYGYIGKLIYLDNFDSDLFQLQWDKSVENILTNSLSDSDQSLYWNAVNSDYANLGLAHGIPNILLLLLRASQRSTDSNVRSRLEETIAKSINYILEQKLSGQDSLYPALIVSDKPNRASRLAWCYGDLGIAFSLIIAGKQFNNKYYFEQGLQSALFCASRNLESSGVHWIEDQDAFDVGWCHGTSGIAYLFRKLSHLVPGKSEFHTAYEYWLTLTIDNLEKKMKSYTSGAPLRMETTDSFSWTPEFSLLEGITGAGLVLIAAMDEDLSSWDALFLTTAST